MIQGDTQTLTEMQDRIRQLFESVRDGSVSVSAASDRLKALPFENLNFACVDVHRAVRHGRPEVVYCPGKSPEQVVEIIGVLEANGQHVLASRATPELYEFVHKTHPRLEYDVTARMIVDPALLDPARGVGDVLVVTAGTSDIPVAAEALLTARACGSRVEAIYDVGVAGLHRLLAHIDRLQRARVIVVVAGMEGALPSVVGGLCGVPVIAVPTSVGYGASFGGVAALLGMLNACSSNITVVNIDNGFGAGYVASMINRLPAPAEQTTKGGEDPAASSGTESDA